MVRKLILVLAFSMSAASCDKYEDLPPTSPSVPETPPSQFDTTGRWTGQTNQGMAMNFIVRPSGNIVYGWIALHHDCTGGRLTLELERYETKLSGDTFSASVTWRVDENGGKYYVGTLSVSGTFLGHQIAKGGFVNSITDKQADNLGVCGPSSGTWEAWQPE